MRLGSGGAPGRGRAARSAPPPGGSNRIESPGLGVVVSGVYSQVDQPSRLGFTWVWQSDGDAAPGEQHAVAARPVIAARVGTERESEKKT